MVSIQGLSSFTIAVYDAQYSMYHIKSLIWSIPRYIWYYSIDSSNESQEYKLQFCDPP